MQTFGHNIRLAQYEKGSTDSHINRQTGINRETLRRWKNAEKTMYSEIINKLCKELDITPNELFSYGEYKW